ncbi:MAG: AmmeMemoRadiSam system protein B [Terriglobia bacterium]
MIVSDRFDFRFLTLLPVLASVLMGCHRARAADKPKVRQPGVAGSFYPADPKELAKMVDGFLAQVTEPALKGPLVALVSPHAGYPFSGPVAAYSYALLRGRKFTRVVVIAPSHYESFPFNSIYDGDAYATPLGQVPVDKAFAAKLVAMSPLIKFSGQGHGEVQGRWEHALEDELPFLQRVLGQFKLVPVVMGEQDYGTSRALGVSLAKLIEKEGRTADGDFKTLIVASSDMSHYHTYDEAETIDHKTLNAIEEWDYFNLSLNSEQRIWEACGGGGIVAAMIAAERLGANRAIVLQYANSGDVTSDKSRVVGYGAEAFVQEAAPRSTKGAELKPENRPEFKLDAKEKQALMTIAKNSVESVVREGKLYECSPGGLEALARDRGAFVTLKKNGDLRGCIGYITPLKPLCLTVRDVAAMAAVRDPRFRPVAAAELGELEYEVSVLSPLRRVTDWKQIQVGRDGLLVREGESQGVLLPQVASEEHWDRMTFLDQTCVKANLPRRCWQNEDTDVFQFSALVFGQPHAPDAVTPDQPALPPSRDTQGRPAPGSPPH